MVVIVQCINKVWRDLYLWGILSKTRFLLVVLCFKRTAAPGPPKAALIPGLWWLLYITQYALLCLAAVALDNLESSDAFSSLSVAMPLYWVGHLSSVFATGWLHSPNLKPRSLAASVTQDPLFGDAPPTPIANKPLQLMLKCETWVSFRILGVWELWTLSQ